jgi:nucleoid-associated protein YgaU
VAAVAVVGILATLVWALWGVVGWLGSGPLAAPEPVPTRPVPVAAVQYIIQPGDTLWAIARSVQPNGEIRPLVDRLSAATHRRPLQVGERIAVP